MKKPIYLDYMSTTPVDPRVVKVMMQCLDVTGDFGNPASRTHIYGWRADELVHRARNKVAGLINADSNGIVFTSGATESINLALKGAAWFYQHQRKHIITCTAEHKAVLDTCHYLERKGFEVTYLTPEKNGLIDIEKIKNALRDDTLMVSIMHVNNEIGVIHDVAKIGALTRERGVLFHVDAAQSAGKVPIDVEAMKIDLLSLSAHKVYGPKGVGALYVKQEPRVRLEPLIHGGGHQRGLRSGTIPTHQVVGMGEAFSIAARVMDKEVLRIRALRDRLWQGIQGLDNVFLNGDGKARVANNLNVSFAGYDTERLITAFKDLAVSTGSACTSAQVEPSHVLRAIALPDALAHSAIRFSLGRFTTEEEIEQAVETITRGLRGV